MYGCAMITRDAGRFTPAAIVDVQQITLIAPDRNPSSTSRFSSACSAAWCHATPFATVVASAGRFAVSVALGLTFRNDAEIRSSPSEARASASTRSFFESIRAMTSH
eukprot:27760-Pelagococcus_subviridis.AAC.9